MTATGSGANEEAAYQNAINIINDNNTKSEVKDWLFKNTKLSEKQISTILNIKSESWVPDDINYTSLENSEKITNSDSHIGMTVTGFIDEKNFREWASRKFKEYIDIMTKGIILDITGDGNDLFIEKMEQHFSKLGFTVFNENNNLLVKPGYMITLNTDIGEPISVIPCYCWYVSIKSSIINNYSSTNKPLIFSNHSIPNFDNRIFCFTDNPNMAEKKKDAIYAVHPNSLKTRVLPVFIKNLFVITNNFSKVKSF